jgi:hypothetical protein
MPSSGPHRVAFVIYGPNNGTDLPLLCARAYGDVVLCDVAGVAPDAVTVDALARLQLAERRHGHIVRLHNASDELLELVAFMGLTEALADR